MILSSDIQHRVTDLGGIRLRLGLDRCRLTPFDHQVIGIDRLVSSRYFFLADEMGAGKTKQVIDAAQVLFSQNVIDQVIVVCPASVRGVWVHPELGELAKHLWSDLPATVVEYHKKFNVWHQNLKAVTNGARRLQWFVTNYDYLRNGHEVEQQGRRKVHVFPIVDELHDNGFATERTLLVLDESSAVKSPKALQTLASLQLRNHCGRVWLLNGTPIANDPLDLYAQGRIMHPTVLGCKDFYEFRGRYAVMSVADGFTKVVRFQNLEDLQQRFAPYVLRRLKQDCLDLPEKLPPVNVPVPLSNKTWDIYREMRDQLCAWLEANVVTAAPHAATKVLRLAQIASGFTGGVEDAVPTMDLGFEEDAPAWVVRPDVIPEPVAPAEPLRWLSREKLDVLQSLQRDLLEAEETLKLLVWTRFRPELDRIAEESAKLHKVMQVGRIHGGQSKALRQQALELLDPRTAPPFPVTVVGITQTGRTGLNLTAAHHAVYVSQDFSLFTRQQSEDRIHRPGQKADVKYYNLIATGPKGQKTVDHLILRTLAQKEDVANWTTNAWVRALKEE